MRMRLRMGLVMLVMSSVASAAVAQGYPVPGPYNALPYYNAGSATSSSSSTGRPPLSPYLNLLNGNNPALNYYYGVRPLLPGAGSGIPQQQPQPPMLNRGGFFQPSVQSKLLTVDEDAIPDTKRSALTSPGGAVSFGNFNGSSRAGVQQGGSFFNRGQQGAGPARR